jgi:hypothetical protein
LLAGQPVCRRRSANDCGRSDIAAWQTLAAPEHPVGRSVGARLSDRNRSRTVDGMDADMTKAAIAEGVAAMRDAYGDDVELVVVIHPEVRVEICGSYDEPATLEGWPVIGSYLVRPGELRLLTVDQARDAQLLF